MRRPFFLASVPGFVLLLGLAAGSAHADLIPDPVNPLIDLSGTGIGSVNTILTLQSNGSETGRVYFDGTTDIIEFPQSGGGDVKTGNSQTQTRTLGELGVTSAEQLRIIVNLNETDGDALLENLSLLVFGAPGGTLTFSTTQNYLLEGASSGTGSSGFQFQLDSLQAAQLQSVFSPNLRVGLDATLSDVGSGNETLFVGNASRAQVIPEPGTVALFASGLLPLVGMAVTRRRRA